MVINIKSYLYLKTLLELTHALFEEQTSPDRCIDSIMERSQMLLKSQKCCVLLVDNAVTEVRIYIVYILPYAISSYYNCSLCI